MTLNIGLKTVFSEAKSKSWNESADTLVTLVVEDDDGWFLFFYPPMEIKDDANRTRRPRKCSKKQTKAREN